MNPSPGYPGGTGVRALPDPYPGLVSSEFGGLLPHATHSDDPDESLRKLSLTRDGRTEAAPKRGPFGYDFTPFM